MNKPTNPEPIFIADDRALDVLNSVAAPWGKQIEWLADGRSLLAWLENAELVPPDAATRLRQKAPPDALDEVAGQARDLREWFRVFVAAHAGRPMEPSALTGLQRINRLLARDAAYRQIEPRIASAHEHARLTGEAHVSSLQWQQHRHWRTPEDLLLPIAAAMGDLICRANFERVKNCEGPTCTLWFHDTSKSHTRRWCMMAICGNRAKAAAHRAKKQSSPQE